MLTKLSNNIDLAFAVAALLFGAFWAVRLGVEQPNQTGLAVFIFSLLYLLFRKKINISQSLPQLKAGANIKKINQVIFILSLCASIWILHDNLYFRPLSYFIITLVAAASIIWEIFYSTDSKGSQAFTLCKIIALGVIVRAGIYYQFPGIRGVDPWAHNAIVQQIASSGYIPDYINTAGITFNSYNIFPIFHIVGATTQITTSLSTYDAIFASVGFFEILSCVFIFLIGRKLVNVKAGLLSALIFCLSADSLWHGTQIIPMSLGIGFVAMLLYIILARDRKNIANIAMMLLIAVALIWTHTIAAFVMLIMLLGIIIGTSLYKRLARNSAHRVMVSLSFVVLFFVFIISWWMRIQVEGQASFFETQVLKLRWALGPGFMVVGPPTELYAPYLAILLDRGGYILLLGLGMIGSLIYLHPRNRSLNGIALVSVIASVILAARLIRAPSVQHAILTGRWTVFEYIALSTLAMVGIIGLVNVIRGNRGRLIMVLFMVLLILFPMITNTSSNTDNPLFRYDVYRTGYTESELTAVTTLSATLRSEPVSDIYFAIAMRHLINHDEYMDMLSSGNKVFIARRYDLFHPEYNERHRIQIGNILGRYPLGRETIVAADYIRQLEADNQALIYSSNTVSVWQIP